MTPTISLSLSHRSRMVVCVLAGVVLAQATAYAGAIIYVDANVVGGGTNGTSWPNAYTNLQNALSTAVSGDEIWVAQGTYYPAAAGSPSVSFKRATAEALVGVMSLYWPVTVS